MERRGVSVQAIGIVGRSYCGSTLMNYALGSHPEVYGGSELTRLLDDRRVQCAICGSACLMWTSEALKAARAVGAEGLYDFLRELTGCPVICDASKNLGHFRKLPEEKTRWAVMTKHPLRFLASFVVNELYRQTGAGDLASASEQVADEDLAAFAAEKVDNISRFYASVVNNCGWLKRRGEIVWVRYEDLVTNPESTLTRLLDGTGLAYLSNMLDYASQEHHPIGGNLGPHTQARRAAGRAIQEGGGMRLRAGFYRQPGMRTDEKWRQAFTRSQIEIVTAAPGYQELCQQLGYTFSEDPRRT
jgi:hypothetical protein